MVTVTDEMVDKARGLDDAMRALAALPEGGDGWRDIDTAPKDGTHIILGCSAHRRSTEGFWYAPEHGKYLGDCGGECRCPEYADAPDPYWSSEDGGFTKESPPTHWQPLPSPPSTQATPPAISPPLCDDAGGGT